jgi:predicted RNase H-like HicB family nuclease
VTDVLTWRRIGDRKAWADDLDTQHSAEGQVTDPRNHPAHWSAEVFAEDRSAEMVEDLPRGLVNAYVDRAMQHAYIREIEPGTWFSAVAGLEGAWGDGDTAEEARSELREALVGWIAVKRRLGYEVPAIDGLDLNLPQATRA